MQYLGMKGKLTHSQIKENEDYLSADIHSKRKRTIKKDS